MNQMMNHDYVEYYVGEAKMTAYWHVHAMGFDVVAYCGPKSGQPDKVSYLLQKNAVTIMITSPIDNSEISGFINRHGSGIKAIGIKVNNIEDCKKHLLQQDAIILQEYQTSDEQGSVSKIDVKLFDNNVITFSDHSDYYGDFSPGFIPFHAAWGKATFDSQIFEIDHIAYVLRKNEIKIWENYLNRIFNSLTVFEFKPETGLNIHLKVLQSNTQVINNVIVEPKKTDDKSQINSFIDHNNSNGIQHLAFRSDHIFTTIGVLRQGGIEFINIPAAYFATLRQKLQTVDVDQLEAFGVLCEKEEEQMLLQTFTEPICDNQTCFYEIIQRDNDYNGFGLNNMTALFEAVEDQIKMNSNI